jgi:hypothetical protein
VSALGIGSGLPVSPLEPADAGRQARIQALMDADALTRRSVLITKREAKEEEKQ